MSAFGRLIEVFLRAGASADSPRRRAKLACRLVLGEELPGGFFAGLTTDAGEKAELFAILAVVIHMGV